MAFDFRIRDFFYPIGIYRLKNTFERTQWLPPDELRLYQEQRLTKIINHAYKHIPYYHNLLKKFGIKPINIKGKDDLNKLPLLTKDNIREEGASLLANNAGTYKPRLYKTSGTTGTADKNHNA